jgi:hypothetical protein
VSNNREISAVGKNDGRGEIERGGFPPRRFDQTNERTNGTDRQTTGRCCLLSVRLQVLFVLDVYFCKSVPSLPFFLTSLPLFLCYPFALCLVPFLSSSFSLCSFVYILVIFLCVSTLSFTHVLLKSLASPPLLISPLQPLSVRLCPLHSYVPNP